MTASVTLTHPSINSGVAVRILCDQVTVGGKRSNIADPNENNEGTQVQVQTQSPQNLIYTIRGVHFTNQTNTLTYAHILTLYRAKYDGTILGSSAAALFTVSYGGVDSAGKYSNTPISLVGFDGTTTSLRVVLDDFNFPVDVKDSKDGYRPIASMTLRETA